MKTLLLILLSLLITTNVYADLPKEIKSNELKWVPFSKQKVAKDVYRAILKKENIEDNEIDGELVAFVDLNYDKKDEIVVKSQRLGGAFLDAYVFFENKNNKWQHILTFTGGFILNNQHPDWFNKKYNDKDKMYYTITQWQRFGSADTWQHVFVYKNDKYVFINSQRVPLTVLYQKDFQKMLLEINGHPLSGDWN